MILGRSIPIDTVAKAIEGSLCFGLFDRSSQIGLARVITDKATFAYLTRAKLTAEEIVEQYPHINLSQIYAALAYYYANRDEIDRELEAEASDFLRLADESKSKP